MIISMKLFKRLFGNTLWTCKIKLLKDRSEQMYSAGMQISKQTKWYFMSKNKSVTYSKLLCKNSFKLTDDEHHCTAGISNADLPNKYDTF